MKIKDITISIFAIIGFVTILSSFNNQSQETHSTPESHVWEGVTSPMNNDTFILNKVTGEVRALGNGPSKAGIYVVMTETR